MKNEEIKGFFDEQLKIWDLASRNFNALENVEKKPFKIGDLNGFIQFNPARAVSTLANVDKVSIQHRKCFLCESNRPEEQLKIEMTPGWDLLVNPFPILPYHFTIVSKTHCPQLLYPEIGSALAGMLPGFVVFFNSDGAGASAPDHAHFQAVPFEELPLINLVNSSWNSGFKNIPFKFYTDSDSISRIETSLNAYFWETGDGVSRALAIPRKNHRPRQYFLESPLRRAVSPGAIDMAGILVCPVKEDYDAFTNRDVEDIYSQTAFKNE